MRRGVHHRLQQVGYPLASVGENLAWGQGRLGTARSAMASWLASPERMTQKGRLRAALLHYVYQSSSE